MKFPTNFVLVIIILLSLNFKTAAQINLSEISIEFGAIKNAKEFYQIDKEKEFSFCPRLSIGGKLVLDIFYWKAIYSHWQLSEVWSDDYIDKYSSNTIGILLQLLTNTPNNSGDLGVRINYGFTVHFYEKDYIRPQIYNWVDKGKFHSRTWYFDIGLELNYKISRLFMPKVWFEYHQHLRTTQIPYFQPLSFGVGLTYNFN